MRRGTALVFGDAGDFLASRMVAGTIALAGRAGAHVGYGMRRGSVVFAGLGAGGIAHLRAGGGRRAGILATAGARPGAARRCLRHAAARGIERQLGDLAAGGKGELIVAR